MANPLRAVQGDLDALRRAVASVPRGKREDCLLRLQMNGTEESPLYWAVQVQNELHVRRLLMCCKDVPTGKWGRGMLVCDMKACPVFAGWAYRAC